MKLSLRPGQFRGVLLFTLVEILTLTAWLQLGPTLLSTEILAAGLTGEHLIATAVGNMP